jgi:hypothetical protein
MSMDQETGIRSINKMNWDEKQRKNCGVFIYRDFLLLECPYIAYMFHKQKLLVEHSDPENSFVTMNMLGEVKVGLETYYYFAFYNDPSKPLLDGPPLLLKSISGKEIYPEGCSLPIKC